MYNSIRKLYNFLISQLFDSLPEILSTELISRQINVVSENYSERIFELKNQSASFLRKFENDILQQHLGEIKSLLNLAFLSIFANDIIDPNLEYTYQEKVGMDLIENERGKLEDETRKMIAEENLLNPRSIDFKILKKLNDICIQFFSSDTKIIKKFINAFMQLFFVEIKWHLKNYDLIKTKALKIISFYEFEFLMSMIGYPEQFTNDENYQKIRTVFADLSGELIDRQKLFSFYKLKLKSMHIRSHYIFVFRVVAAPV